jgi:CheY-like chemotaxis protein
VINGQEAIDFLRDRVSSLLILDVSMPVVEGFSVPRIIRSSDRPEQAAMPITVLTASAMKGDREKCLAAGASEYLAKPVKIQELDQTTRRILETAGERGWPQAPRFRVHRSSWTPFLRRERVQPLRFCNPLLTPARALSASDAAGPGVSPSSWWRDRSCLIAFIRASPSASSSTIVSCRSG